MLCQLLAVLCWPSQLCLRLSKFGFWGWFRFWDTQRWLQNQSKDQWMFFSTVLFVLCTGKWICAHQDSVPIEAGYTCWCHVCVAAVTSTWEKQTRDTKERLHPIATCAKPCKAQRIILKIVETSGYRFTKKPETLPVATWPGVFRSRKKVTVRRAVETGRWEWISSRPAEEILEKA